MWVWFGQSRKSPRSALGQSRRFTFGQPLPVYPEQRTVSAPVSRSVSCRFCCKSLFEVTNENS
jgi:hypothetical protein